MATNTDTKVFFQCTKSTKLNNTKRMGDQYQSNLKQYGEVCSTTFSAFTQKFDLSLISRIAQMWSIKLVYDTKQEICLKLANEAWKHSCIFYKILIQICEVRNLFAFGHSSVNDILHHFSAKRHQQIVVSSTLTAELHWWRRGRDSRWVATQLWPMVLDPSAWAPSSRRNSRGWAALDSRLEIRDSVHTGCEIQRRWLTGVEPRTARV